MEEMNKKLEVMNKKLEEMNKKLEERDRQLDKKLEEMTKKLEERTKKLEERDKQPTEICNKDPVTYIVSSTGKAWEYRRHCMGEYYPTGKYVNGFPIFRNGEIYLYVSTGGIWIIGSELGSSRGQICQPHKNPTQSTPPRNGWKVGMGGGSNSWVEDASFEVNPRSFITYRVGSTRNVGSTRKNAKLESIKGDYHPTGEFLNGFPIFRKGEIGSLCVGPDKQWMILGSKAGYFISQPDNNPTPSTPPVVGWNFPGKMDKSPTFVTVIPVIGFYP